MQSSRTEMVECGCGGKPVILKADEYHQFPNTYYVSCTKCTAGVGPYDTKENAIQAWNTAIDGRVDRTEPCPVCGSDMHLDWWCPNHCTD